MIKHRFWFKENYCKIYNSTICHVIIYNFQNIEQKRQIIGMRKGGGEIFLVNAIHKMDSGRIFGVKINAWIWIFILFVNAVVSFERS